MKLIRYMYISLRFVKMYVLSCPQTYTEKKNLHRVVVRLVNLKGSKLRLKWGRTNVNIRRRSRHYIFNIPCSSPVASLSFITLLNVLEEKLKCNVIVIHVVTVNSVLLLSYQ